MLLCRRNTHSSTMSLHTTALLAAVAALLRVPGAQAASGVAQLLHKCRKVDTHEEVRPRRTLLPRARHPSLCSTAGPACMQHMLHHIKPCLLTRKNRWLPRTFLNVSCAGLRARAKANCSSMHLPRQRVRMHASLALNPCRQPATHGALKVFHEATVPRARIDVRCSSS